jgi:membrane glycosyltransferase
MSYASSLFWLVSLLFGTLLAIGFARTGLTWLPEPALADVIGRSAESQAAALTALTFILLFTPKVLAVADRRRQESGLATFGGAARTWAGVILETLLSALVAPVLMLFHANFVLATIFGQGVRWVTQRREGHTTWREAVVSHAGQTTVGLGWLVLLAVYTPPLLPWMIPVLAGLLLSTVFSQLTARETLGQALRRRGILCTPEEIAPPTELRELESDLREATRACAARRTGTGFAHAVLNPLANALHVALQRERLHQPEATRQFLLRLEEKALREGPGALASAEKNFLLSDPASMTRLHRAVWTRPLDLLAADWRVALARCAEPGPDITPGETTSARPRLAAGILRFAPKPEGMAPI